MSKTSATVMGQGVGGWGVSQNPGKKPQRQPSSARAPPTEAKGKTEGRTEGQMLPEEAGNVSGGRRRAAPSFFCPDAFLVPEGTWVWATAQTTRKGTMERGLLPDSRPGGLPGHVEEKLRLGKRRSVPRQGGKKPGAAAAGPPAAPGGRSLNFSITSMSTCNNSFVPCVGLFWQCMGLLFSLPF